MLLSNLGKGSFRSLDVSTGRYLHEKVNGGNADPDTNNSFADNAATSYKKNLVNELISILDHLDVTFC